MYSEVSVDEDMIYSYDKHINGFSAILDEDAAAKLAGIITMLITIYSFILFIMLLCRDLHFLLNSCRSS